MKKIKVSLFTYCIVIFFSLLYLPSLNAQCDAGDPRTIEIDLDENDYGIYSIDDIDLDRLLYAFDTDNPSYYYEDYNFSKKSILVRETSWKYKRGPSGPRGKRRPVKITTDKKASFPNTGSGPTEYYVFEYTVTDESCSETTEITIAITLYSAEFDQENIYICSGDLIHDATLLFNAFPLDGIREAGNWPDGDAFNPSTDWFDNNFNYVDFITGIGDGGYTYEDPTNNYIVAVVKEIDCDQNKDIKFSFKNSQNTSDGVNDYFEVDVMIEKTAGDDFKLGQGKLFFRYNKDAFGEFISILSEDDIVIAPSNDYILDSSIYTSRTLDNRNNLSINRFSWSFRQKSTVNAIATKTINNTPQKLCRIKLKYLDKNEDPGLVFEEGDIYDNKFTTACGWDANGSINNCNQQARTLLVNDSFDSQILSNKAFKTINDISLYPNPTNQLINLKGNIKGIVTIEVFDISGKLVKGVTKNFKTIDIRHLDSGIYFFKIIDYKSSKTFKVIKE